MINQYEIIDYSKVGLPSIDVYGEKFNYIDLYKLVGQNQFMTTFTLKPNSDSHNLYGSSVLGTIYYDKKSLTSLEEDSDLLKSENKIRIDSPPQTLSEDKRGDLKYTGIAIEDIEYISFLAYSQKVERHETGEKKIPNIINIEVDFDGIDPDKLNQSYLVRKHNAGTELIQFEKEQLIGILLAFNNGTIDSRILNTFGFTLQDIESNLNIWIQIYKVKERKNQLTEIDKKNYIECSSIIKIERMTIVFKEFKQSNIFNSSKSLDVSSIKKIFDLIDDFSPSILMHGKKQVYWDFDSYAHIMIRHIQDFQIGAFKSKTSLPYKSSDLKTLIEKVLGKIEPEIKNHFASNPSNEFKRVGKMAVLFHGDHYNLRINQEGKLIQFHSVS